MDYFSLLPEDMKREAERKVTSEKMKNVLKELHDSFIINDELFFGEPCKNVKPCVLYLGNQYIKYGWGLFSRSYNDRGIIGNMGGWYIFHSIQKAKSEVALISKMTGQTT
jgi:hypothetical protein